ncbi:hypothetical protein SteCoe_19847 [Stentor coeruleus]|uniref:P-type ATPase A domain-containing protein n=1 Tax=Stentor coeruleus TaxID=5963 RepID=A0A1R2BT46_9CILI|nr:hypothetical protein SteCoe_19847 [Stentor coeruleus]
MSRSDSNVQTSLDDRPSIQVQYLKSSLTGLLAFIICLIFTGGLFYLPYRWLLVFQKIFYKKCDIDEASHILVSSNGLDHTIVKLYSKKSIKSVLDNHAIGGKTKFIMFKYKNEVFYYQEELGMCLPLVFNTRLSFNEFHSMKEGLSSKILIKNRQKIFGPSVIDVPIPKIFEIFINEILEPFFVFQIFSVVIWLAEKYAYYAITIFFIMCITLIANVYLIQRNLKRLKSLATFITNVDVLRNGTIETISSCDLVPGDIVIITDNLTFPCDMILLSGFCLVNETMLTGESQPVIKEALPEINNIYNKDKLYTLNAGTSVIDKHPQSFAVVISIGYCTVKGELVRSILYPKSSRFKFERDSWIFIACMFGIALIGFFIAIKPLNDGGIDSGNFVLKLFDLITISVPPALRLTMTIGIVYSMRRLKKKKINCISQSAINCSGRVSVVCFDKTGTLTKDEMSLNYVYDINLPDKEILPGDASLDFQKCMACCNSFTILNGLFIGDPQEIAIINALNWKTIMLENGKINFVSPDDRVSLTSNFIFHFSPELKRMGVIVEENGIIYLYMKGAPEVIFPLCENVPEDMYQLFLKYTRKGYRVLACAYKVLDNFDVNSKLEDNEKDLMLLGLPLLENLIKDDAFDVISTLDKADIHCVISTGDNVLTGISVAKKLSFIKSENVIFGDYVGLEIVWEDDDGKRLDDLPSGNNYEVAITGNLLERIITENREYMFLIRENCKVFGRMSPKHKIMLIECFQVGEIMVSMVGDGANDCGALKQADVGISLSKAEASIAAPFSTLELSNIIYILKEGRCALATSFQCFKFMFMYSIIQFTCAIILYLEKTNLTNSQYMYQDIFTILPLTFTMAASLPHHKLSKRMPPGSLISVPILLSIGFAIIQAIGYIVAAICIVKSMLWYKKECTSDHCEVGKSTIDEPLASIEGNVIFLQGTVQLIGICTIFSMGKPFREPIYKNKPFVITVTILFAFNIYFLLDRSEFTYNFIELFCDDHMDYRWIMLGIYIGGSILTFLIERLIVPTAARFIKACFHKKRKHLASEEILY